MLPGAVSMSFVVNCFLRTFVTSNMMSSGLKRKFWGKMSEIPYLVSSGICFIHALDPC